MLCRSDENKVAPVEGLLFVYAFLCLPIVFMLVLRVLRPVLPLSGTTLLAIVASLIRSLVILPLIAWYLKWRGVSLADGVGLRAKGTLSALARVPWLAVQAAVVMFAVQAAQFFLLKGLGIKRQPQEVVQVLAQSRGLGTVILLVLTAVVLAPVVEEIIFRGLLFRPFCQRFGRLTGYLFSAFVFAFCHFDRFVFAPLFVLAIILAWSYERTNKIVVPIVLHALQNGLTVYFILTMRG